MKLNCRKLSTIIFIQILEFVELIRYLSKKFPKQKIIIRPHFAENKSDWEKI